MNGMNVFLYTAIIFYGVSGFICATPVALESESANPLNSMSLWWEITKAANIFGKFLMLFVLPIFVVASFTLLLVSIFIITVKIGFYKKEDWKKLKNNYSKIFDL